MLSRWRDFCVTFALCGCCFQIPKWCGCTQVGYFRRCRKDGFRYGIRTRMFPSDANRTLRRFQPRFPLISSSLCNSCQSLFDDVGRFTCSLPCFLFALRVSVCRNRCCRCVHQARSIWNKKPKHREVTIIQQFFISAPEFSGSVRYGRCGRVRRRRGHRLAQRRWISWRGCGTGGTDCSLPWRRTLCRSTSSSR